MKRNLLFGLITALATLFTFSLFAQNGVSINSTGAAPSGSAILDLSNTLNEGFIIPHVALTSVSTLSPVPGPGPAGLIVYDTNANVTGGQGIGFYYWNGSNSWYYVLNSGNASGAFWGLTGNTGTTPGTNYMGTADLNDFVIKTNFTQVATITAAGLFGAGALSKSPAGINGGLALGTYAGNNAAPSNGEILPGKWGMGTSAPAASALVDMTTASPYLGLLIPRVPLLSLTDISTIPSPAEYMIVMNTTTKCMEWFNGTNWQIIQCLGGNPCTQAPGSLGSISGHDTVLINSNGNIYSVAQVNNVNYTWSITPNGNGTTITSGQGTATAGFSFGSAVTTYTITVYATNPCGIGPPSTLVIQSSLCLVQHGKITFIATAPVYYSWTVPCGINTITIQANGAQGGYNNSQTQPVIKTPGYGGLGATVQGAFGNSQGIKPGVVLVLVVGAFPGITDGIPGGGGGSFVARGANYATDTALIVAGGGGAGFDSIGHGADTGVIPFGGPYALKIGKLAGSGGETGWTYGSSCTGGGGGFHSSGAADSSYGFGGGTGFQEGAAGGCATAAQVTACGCGTIQCGGWGGGGYGDYADFCNAPEGAGGGYFGGVGMEYPASIPNYNWPLMGRGNAGGSYNSGIAGTKTGKPANNTSDGFIVIYY